MAAPTWLCELLVQPTKIGHNAESLSLGHNAEHEDKTTF